MGTVDSVWYSRVERYLREQDGLGRGAVHQPLGDLRRERVIDGDAERADRTGAAQPLREGPTAYLRAPPPHRRPIHGCSTNGSRVHCFATSSRVHGRGFRR